MKPEAFFRQNKSFFVDDREKTAEYVKKHFPENARLIIGASDDAVEHRFVFELRWDMERTSKPVVFGKEIDWLRQPADDPEWIYSFNRMRFWVCMGQAYAMTGDEKYAEEFAAQMCHWVEHVKRGDPKNALAWRTIETGIRMENWLKAMALFEGSPAITGDVMDRFVASMTEHAEYIMSVYDPYNLMSNWGVLANHGLFLAGVMLPETPRTAEYRREALRRLGEEARIQVYRDGTQWEQSPMYHNEVLRNFLDVVLLAHRNNIALPEGFEETTRAMCYADLYGAKPDGNEISMGDSDEIDQRDLLSEGACLFRDGVLKSGAYGHLDCDTVWEMGYCAAAAYDAIVPQEPEKTAHALPDSGNFYFRSDWGNDASFLHFHCGTLGAGHGHSDQLHFDLFANGEDLLMDAGRFTYVNKPERFEFKGCAAHNTCTADGREFTVCADSWGCSKLCRAVNRKFAECGPYGYAEGGHLGYYDLETGGLFVNRRVVCIEPDIFVIADEFYADAAHIYQQYLHFNNHGRVEGAGRSFRYLSDRSSMEVRLVGNGLVSSELTETRISRHYNQAESNLTLKTELRGNGFASAFTVLFVSPAGTEEPVHAEKVEVHSNFKHIVFEDKLIEALDIRKGERHYTLVVAHQEYASPTDTFCADGCTGFGNVVVFDRAKGEDTIGTVLAY